MKRALIATAFALLTACAQSAADAPIAEQWRALEVEIQPVAFGRESVGRLRFRGGLELARDDGVFGGFSGLEMLEDGRFVAISDNGDWFEGRLVLDDAGALADVVDLRTALMRDEDGEPFQSKAEGDSEGLTQLADGRFAVSFEQTQSIRIYDLNRDGPFGAARSGPRLDGVARLPRNAGLEALATASDGTLIVGAEGGGAAAPLWRAPLDAAEPVAPRISYPLSAGYSLTGLDRLPDGGGFVALERFYAPVIGARARIVRFPESALDARGEALPETEELAVLAPPMPVDNFEAIAMTRAPDGALRIYILSDDNFSRRQRTLLLAFDLAED